MFSFGEFVKFFKGVGRVFFGEECDDGICVCDKKCGIGVVKGFFFCWAV